MTFWLAYPKYHFFTQLGARREAALGGGRDSGGSRWLFNRASIVIMASVVDGLMTKGDERMLTAKDNLIQAIKQLPDDSTYDQILRQLAFEVMVKKGLEDSDAGRTTSNEALLQRIESWRR